MTVQFAKGVVLAILQYLGMLPMDSLAVKTKD